MNKFLLLCFVIHSAFLCAVAKQDHQVIYFISPPRSLSVAFTRMMYERGDFEILHEPSQYVYNKKYWPEVTSWFSEDAYATFEEVKKSIFTMLEYRSVFVKEISFAVEELLLNDDDFIRDERVHFVFLIRNPHHTAISFYKKVGWNFPMMDHLLGYQSLYHIYQKVEKVSPNPPLILLTEDLYNRPEDTIRHFCDFLQIAYLPQALHWSPLGPSFDITKEWHEIKVGDSTLHWHGEALHSSGFGKPSPYAIDQDGQPTFEEIADPSHREYYREAYEHNLPYYELLKGAHDPS